MQQQGAKNKATQRNTMSENTACHKQQIKVVPVLSKTGSECCAPK